MPPAAALSSKAKKKILVAYKKFRDDVKAITEKHKNNIQKILANAEKQKIEALKQDLARKS